MCSLIKFLSALTAEIQSGDEVIRGWETESKMPQKSDEIGFVLHEDGEKNFTGSHVERLVRNDIATVRCFGKIYLLGDRYCKRAVSWILEKAQGNWSPTLMKEDDVRE